jgi:hypothetical protein
MADATHRPTSRSPRSPSVVYFAMNSGLSALARSPGLANGCVLAL